MLSIGSNAPEFQLSDQDGNTVNIKDFEGQKVLLWFYPCLLYTSPSPRDATLSRMPSSA